MATLSSPALPPSGRRRAGGLQTPDQNAAQVIAWLTEQPR